MFYYKLSTTKTIHKSKVFSFFDKIICNRKTYNNKEVYNCQDGSILILHESNAEKMVFVEFYNKLTPISHEKKLSLGSLNLFSKFCLKNNSKIKILRNKLIVSPSGGALFSDLYGSEAFRRGMHMTLHPNDKK